MRKISDLIPGARHAGFVLATTTIYVVTFSWCFPKTCLLVTNGFCVVVHYVIKNQTGICLLFYTNYKVRCLKKANGESVRVKPIRFRCAVKTLSRETLEIIITSLIFSGWSIKPLSRCLACSDLSHHT